MSIEANFNPTGMTALVLDRNVYERGISLDLLRSMGFSRALGAGDTLEGWELLRKLDPTIILMDWLDGAADPLDFVRRVRRSDDAPNRAVTIMMLTSRGGRAEVEAARHAGVNGYLRKPVSALALSQHVRTAIGNPQPFIVTATYVGPCRRRRFDENYMGPWRRLDDTANPDTAAAAEEVDIKTQLARARVAALEATARDLKPGDAQAARAVFAATLDLLKVAEQIGDFSLILGAKEMMRYLQAQGATERLDPDVVRTHVAALHQLVHLPHALAQERESVAQGLKRMVDKKLRQAIAA